MDFWLLSLVIVSISVGWVIGRWLPFKKKYRDNQFENYSDSYAQGLNYLLSDDSENAIKVFANIIEVSPSRIEIHLSLGNFFRSKGEVDQAIKVHQELLALTDLSQMQRNTVIAELANDYLKAGLLGRAEQLFKELIGLDKSHTAAYGSLLDIYITQKSWNEAIIYAQILFDRQSDGASATLSQCLCEGAEEALTKGNTQKAKTNLTKALEADKNCIRATLLLIQWHLNAQNNAQAQKIFQLIIIKNPEYMTLYIEPAKHIFLHANELDKYELFLQQQYQQQPSTQLAIALLEHYLATNKLAQARQFLSEVLDKVSSFGAYDLALQFIRSDSTERTDSWQGLSNLLKLMQEKKTQFVCTQCGYGSQSIQWHCPSCRRWSSMKPV